jgi:predicted nuclease of predicted toxin-antitoxin system
VIDPLLVDECLTPELAAVARARGHEAHHLVHLGRAGMQDWSIVQYLVAHDFALVTNNARDFLALFAQLEMHNGLVIILPSVPACEQVRLFGLVLDAIEPLTDLVNRLVTVDVDGRVEIRDWPDAASA